MKKEISIIICGLALLMLAACSGRGFKKTKSGLLYKIVSDGKGETARRGQFLKIHFRSKVHDSVMTSTYGNLPVYEMVDSVGPIYNAAEIFTLLRKGDSAIVVLSADTLFKQQGGLPPFIKRKDKITIVFSVMDILHDEAQKQKDLEQLIEAQKQKEIKTIENYLAKNNIQAQKAPKGTLVLIENPGSGPACDTGKLVKVMYTGKTFDGKIFDSNLDPKFGHTDPYPFVIGEKRGVMEGWDDGLRLFRKGGKGKLYIPSMLAYANNPPNGAPFKAFDNLIFDVEVVDVTDKPKAVNPPNPKTGTGNK